MGSKGMIVEKLTIGWLQLIISAFTLGGLVYSMVLLKSRIDLMIEN